MGRARNGQSAAAVAQLARRESRSSSTLHPQTDALWFAHSRDLVEATKLLRSLDRFDSRQEERLLRTMRRVSTTAGLHGEWRILEDHTGAFLGYCARIDSDPGLETSEWHQLSDRFTGGTINGLPEPRYLGRMVQQLSDTISASPVAHRSPTRDELVMDLALAALRRG